MRSAASESVNAPAPPGLVPATVASVEGPRTVLCQVGDRVARATIAVVAGAYAPRAGDGVLVAPGANGELYVLGVLVALRDASAVTLTPDGVRATVTPEGDPDAGGAAVRLHDPDGRPLFEYRTRDGRCTVFTPDGDLEIRADAGSITLSAAQDVRIDARRAASVAAPALDVESARATARLLEGRLEAAVFTSAVDQVRHVVGVLETRVEQLVERARATYRDVEEVAQTRAGTLRLLADVAFQLRGKRALLTVDEEMRLKAEKIQLA